MYRILASIALFCGVLLIPGMAPTQSSAGSIEPWRKQISDCLRQKSGTAVCPVRIYELEADDPSDKMSFGGGIEVASPLLKEGFIRRDFRGRYIPKWFAVDLSNGKDRNRNWLLIFGK